MFVVMGNHPKISKQGTKHHEFSPLIYSDGLPPVVLLFEVSASARLERLNVHLMKIIHFPTRHLFSLPQKNGQKKVD